MNEFTAIIETDGDRFIAYCPEIPGANGQGPTKEEARQSLAGAIALILDDRREDARRGLPPGAITVSTAATSSARAVPTRCGPTPGPAPSRPFRATLPSLGNRRADLFPA